MAASLKPTSKPVWARSSGYRDAIPTATTTRRLALKFPISREHDRSAGMRRAVRGDRTTVYGPSAVRMLPSCVWLHHQCVTLVRDLLAPEAGVVQRLPVDYRCVLLHEMSERCSGESASR
jgi:hypothetical protein